MPKLSDELFERGVKILRQRISAATLMQVENAMDTDGPDWLHKRMPHFIWGMSVRNLLRQHGFTDDVAGMDLDDCYVALVEEAARRGPLKPSWWRRFREWFRRGQ